MVPQPSLADLPVEIHQQIVDFLDRSSQKQYSLANRRAWDLATNNIWREVNLIDRRTRYHVPKEQRLSWQNGWLGQDEHDDTPIICKFFALAFNRRLAAKVQIVTHRCHLPTPAIFAEIPSQCCENPTLSSDWRTIRLAELAIQNMSNVVTLRLINGHYNLANILLSSLFAANRAHPRKLWIESCAIKYLPDAEELCIEHLRLRRLRFASAVKGHWLYSRAGYVDRLHNGTGSLYETTLYGPNVSDDPVSRISEKAFEDTDVVPLSVRWLNEQTYNRLPQVTHYLNSTASRGFEHLSRLRTSPDTLPIDLCKMSSSSLRSLNLDWVLLTSQSGSSPAVQAFERLSRLTFPYLRSFQIRNAVTDCTQLPCEMYLFQPVTEDIARAAKIEHTMDFLSFMERHTRLNVLAWPMDRFFSHREPIGDAELHNSDRARAIIFNLGRSLTSLRVDSYYNHSGEALSDDSTDPESLQLRKRRRLFISRFASEMRQLKQLKIEGGIPRDEKREIVRASHRCPLEKLVMIGTSCPIANTWGRNGEDLALVDEGYNPSVRALTEEHEATLIEGMTTPSPYAEDHSWQPTYGWYSSPSLLHTIAQHHASTITELKLCGYNGAPVLFKTLPLTLPLLYHLRYFHKLRRITMSFWLLTFMDHDWREAEILNLWSTEKSIESATQNELPHVQALALPAADTNIHANPEARADMLAEVIVSSGGASSMTGDIDNLDSNNEVNDTLDADMMMAVELGTGLFSDDNTTLLPGDPEPIDIDPIPMNDLAFETRLKQHFAPDHLAAGVYDVLAPHLSLEARETGIEIRASFCLGIEVADVFDLDFKIDGEGIVKGSRVGPRGENEPRRWWSKLESRQWT